MYRLDLDVKIRPDWLQNFAAFRQIIQDENDVGVDQ
jgi:hypothetical protein